MAAPGPGPGHPDPQADLAHHHHREPAPRGPDRPSPGQAGGQHLPAVAPRGRLPPAPAGGVHRRPATPTADEQDTGAEAWDEEATHADDLVTETEAGPLEESDLDADTEGADEATPADDLVTETEAGPLEASDLDPDTEGADEDTGEASDQDVDEDTTATAPKRRASRWARR